MDDAKNTTISAFRLIFRPIARILLLAGVTWKEIAEVAKATFVEVASSEFGIRGRPTNVSRLAILTGFTRKEVARLRNLLASEDTQLIEKMNHATRVLTGWYSDPEFLSEQGAPLALATHGKGSSFETLCRRYASDVPVTTMLKELKHVSAVVDSPTGELVVQMRYYMPLQMDPQQILSSGSVMQDLGNTVAHNLFRKKKDPARFERRATNTRVAPEVVPQFQAYLEDEGQAFLERVDAWLSQHELDNNSAADGIRLGLGAYWIQQ